MNLREATLPRPSPGIDPVLYVRDYFTADYYVSSKETIPAQQTAAEVALIEDVFHLRQHPERRLLDLACGYGRLLVPLVHRGFRVEGLDWCDGYLGHIRAELDPHQQDLHLIDMREMRFSECFEGVLCYYTSLNYFTDADTLRILRNVYAALKPGGGFLVEMQDRHWREADFKRRQREGQGRVHYYLPAETSLVRLEVEDLSLEDGWLITCHRLWVDALPHPERYALVRLFYREELETLLAEAGFAVTSVWGAPDKELYEPGQSARLIIHASKKEE